MAGGNVLLFRKNLFGNSKKVRWRHGKPDEVTILADNILGQGKSTYPLSVNANILSATPRLLVTR